MTRRTYPLSHSSRGARPPTLRCHTRLAIHVRTCTTPLPTQNVLVRLVRSLRIHAQPPSIRNSSHFFCRTVCALVARGISLLPSRGHYPHAASPHRASSLPRYAAR